MTTRQFFQAGIALIAVFVLVLGWLLYAYIRGPAIRSVPERALAALWQEYEGQGYEIETIRDGEPQQGNSYRVHYEYRITSQGGGEDRILHWVMIWRRTRPPTGAPKKMRDLLNVLDARTAVAFKPLSEDAKSVHRHLAELAVGFGEAD